MRVHFTSNNVSSFKVPPGKTRAELCCDVVRGLYLELRATAPGRGSWYYRYKNSSKQTKHKLIGGYPEVSLADARKAAQTLKAEIRLNGADPSKERQEQKAVPTLRAFFEEQYLPYIKARKRSWRGDENRMRQRLLPAFGDQPMNTITRKQIVEFHLALKEEGLASSTCDHCPKQLRALYNVAVQWGVVKENPAAKIPLFNEWNQVENYLTEEQLAKLLSVLRSHEQRLACQVALFLLSCGQRLNEVLSMTIEQLDLQTNVWTIPAANSKSKRVRAVPLNDSALAVLDELQVKARTGPVFVNPRTQEQLKTVHKAWGKIRVAAGLPFLRIHDLRHLHASFLVNAGRTLYEVQQLLGHSSPLVTQRYAHLNQRTLQAASDSASDRIEAATPKLLPALPQPDAAA